MTSGVLTPFNIYTGDNTAVISVENADGAAERYIVVINRAESGVRAETTDSLKLDNLEVQGQVLVPTFDSKQYTYVVIVDNDVETVDMAAEFNESNMSVTINNIPMDSGQELTDAEIGYIGDDHLGITELEVGSNYFDIVLTSKKDYTDTDGSTAVKDSQTKVHYVVNVVRRGDTIAELDYLATDKGTMAPVFDPSIYNYYATVPYDVDSIIIDTDSLLTAYPAANASLEQVVYSASSNATVIDNGDGTITLIPPASQDSTVIFLVYPSSEWQYPTSAYSIKVNRRTNETVKSIDLESIEVSADGAAVPLTTEFTPRDVNYYVYVDSDVTEVNVTATPEYSGTLVSGDGTIKLTGDVTTAIITTGDSDSAAQRYSLTIIKSDSTAELTTLTVNSDQLTLTDSAQTYVTDVDTSNAIAMQLDSLSADDVIRVNGRRVTDGEFNADMITDREKYDIRVTTQDGKSYVYTLFVNDDDDEDYFEPYLTDIIVRDGNGASGTFDKTVTGNVHTYNVMVDTADIELFARSMVDEIIGGVLTGSKISDEDVTIEMFDEELNDYLVSTSFNNYISASVNGEMSTFRFRATEFAQSSFENVTEYIVNVYNTENPILTSLEVSPSPDAVMTEAFKATKTDYTVYIGKSVDNFDVTAESFASMGIEIGLVDSTTGDTAYGTSANPNTTNIETPLSENTFTVNVKVSYTKTLADGSTQDRSQIYTLNVVRSPYDASDVYLANLTVVEEDEPDNGLYELDSEYNKVVRVYNTTINYIDNFVSLVIEKENESDRVFAKLGTDNSYEMFTDVSQEFIMPTEFMTDDDATAEIEFTVYNSDGEVGHYKVIVSRGERLDGELRLESLTLDSGDTPLDPDFNSEVWRYTAVVPARQESIFIDAVAKEPADTVVITHNGTSTNNVHKINTEFALSDTEDTDVFFITVSSSGAETDEANRTYVLIVEKMNTAFLTNLEVTDDDTSDSYYELDPTFNQGTSHYTVTVPVLAQEIEFTATADTDGGNITGTTIAVKQDGSVIADEVTDSLSVIARLDLSLTSYDFEFIIQNDDGDYGIYRVNVIREVPADTPAELQTKHIRPWKEAMYGLHPPQPIRYRLPRFRPRRLPLQAQSCSALCSPAQPEEREDPAPIPIRAWCYLHPMRL